MIQRFFRSFSLLSFLFLSPALAYAAPPPLSVYGQLPGIERVKISPSGDRIALIGVAGAGRELIVIDKNSKPLFRADIGEAKVRGLHWAGEDRILVIKSNTANLSSLFLGDKAELYSAIVVPLNGEKSWSIFQGEQMITGGVRGFYGVAQREGKWFGYFGGVTLEGREDSKTYLQSTAPVLYEVNLGNQNTHKIADRVTSGHRSWLVGPDGRVNAALDYQSRDGIWTIRNGAMQKIASGTSKLAGIDLAGLGMTENMLIYESADDDTGVEHWFEQPLAGGEAKEILADVRVADSIFESGSHHFLGYEINGDLPAYHFFDPHQQKIVAATLKAFPGLAVQIIDWDGGFDRLIVKTEGEGDSQTWWLVDIKTGQAQDLGQSYRLPPQEVGSIRTVRYKATDGQEIAAILTLPPGRAAKNLPVMIFPHGGPTAHDSFGFDWWAQAFASRGYAVLQPNFRGSTGYGAAFQKAGDGEWGRKMQTDLSDGLAYLAKEGIVDGKRACIMGKNYGGYAALAGVTLQQGIYRCAIAVAGISDLAKMASTKLTESGGNDALRRGLTQEIGAYHDLGAISPIRFVENVAAPILLIHGKNDTVVHYDQSNDMAAALRQAGKTVEFITLPGEDHWLSNGTTRLAMLEAAVAFAEKYNPPDSAQR